MLKNKTLWVFYLNNIFRQLSAGFIGLFGVIFFYELFNNVIAAVLLVFAIRYFIYGSSIAIVARLFGKIPRSWLLIIGSIFHILALATLVFLQDYPAWIFVLYSVFSGLYYVFFFLPYNITFSQLTHNGKRGHEIGGLSVFSSIISIVLPFVSGYIIFNFSYTVVFTISLIFLILSIFPLLSARDKEDDTFDFHFLECFKILFSKGHRSLLIAHTASGFNNIAKGIFWPLFMFIILSGEYLQVGIITSIAGFVAVALRYLFGVLLDSKKYGDKVFFFTSKLESLGWIFRLLAMTPLHVLLADLFFRFSNSINGISFRKIFIDHVDAEPVCADEYLVIRTIALNIGRLAMLALGFVVITFFGLKYVFILAAIAVFLTGNLEREEGFVSKNRVCQ